MTLDDHGAAISLYPTGGVSGLSLFDHYSILRVALDVEHDGTPLLQFHGSDGKRVKQLP